MFDIRKFSGALLLIAASFVMGPAPAQAAATDVIPASALIRPADLAAEMKGAVPTILQVGFSKLYQQAHIPGAIYAGPGRSDEGLANLRAQAGRLSRDAPLVIYCGCCPWNRCPNMGAAYTALKAMGFTHLKALYIADNFGQDWVDKGYPVVRGQ
jgi:thiosulfate/3-mercaptopyruvate sulfurtransferase